MNGIMNLKLRPNMGFSQSLHNFTKRKSDSELAEDANETGTKLYSPSRERAVSSEEGTSTVCPSSR